MHLNLVSPGAYLAGELVQKQVTGSIAALQTRARDDRLHPGLPLETIVCFDDSILGSGMRVIIETTGQSNGGGAEPAAEVDQMTRTCIGFARVLFRPQHLLGCQHRE